MHPALEDGETPARCLGHCVPPPAPGLAKTQRRGRPGGRASRDGTFVPHTTTASLPRAGPGDAPGVTLPVLRTSAQHCVPRVLLLVQEPPLGQVPGGHERDHEVGKGGSGEARSLCRAKATGERM